MNEKYRQQFQKIIGSNKSFRTIFNKHFLKFFLFQQKTFYFVTSYIEYVD